MRSGSRSSRSLRAAPSGSDVLAQGRHAIRRRRARRESAFVLRFFGERGTTIGCSSSTSDADRALVPAPEPLLAPPDGERWRMLWSPRIRATAETGVVPPDTDGADGDSAANRPLVLGPARPREEHDSRSSASTVAERAAPRWMSRPRRGPDESVRHPRVARHQRARRLRLAAPSRRRDAPLPRAARSPRCRRRSGRTMLLAPPRRGRAPRRTARFADWTGSGSPGNPRSAPPRRVRLELGLPVWRYESRAVVIERRVVDAARPQHRSCHELRLVGGTQPRSQLELEPWVHFRPHDGALDSPARRALRAHGRRRALRGHVRDGVSAPSHACLDGEAALLHDRPRSALRDVRYLLESQPRLRLGRRAVQPGLLSRRARPRVRRRRSLPRPSRGPRSTARRREPRSFEAEDDTAPAAARRG